jgi:branched-chain amino acid transport system permease protein
MLILAAIYTVLAVSLDLVAGQTGLLSMAQAAFYGIGAYASALLAVHCGAGFFVGIMVGVASAGCLSFAVSLPSLRLHDDYFAIATFAFQMIFFSLFNNWLEVTRGPLGIPGIPRPVIVGWKVDSLPELLIVAMLLAASAFFAVNMISSSPFGRVLRAIREDEIFAQSLGKKAICFKVTVFAISAAMAAMSGSLYAHFITYIDPTSFTVMESILVIAMVIIGGVGGKWGPVLGAVVLVTLPEVLRFVGMPSAIAANMRQILYGAALVACMLWRPQGLVGEYAFGRETKPK